MRPANGRSLEGAVVRETVYYINFRNENQIFFTDYKMV